jgi:hypothetical protein
MTLLPHQGAVLTLYLGGVEAAFDALAHFHHTTLPACPAERWLATSFNKWQVSWWAHGPRLLKKSTIISNANACD